MTPDVEATCDALEEMHGVTFGKPDPGLGNARTAALEGGARIGVRAPLREDEEPVVRPYILHLAISDEPEVASVELSPNITAELNAAGELIGIEILSASDYVRDSILESAQAKILQLPRADTA